MRNTVITVALFVVGLIGACVTAWYGMTWETSQTSVMAKDLVTTVFQFFVIVVLGGCISFVHQLLTQQREDRERDKNRRREKRGDERQLLLNTYNEFLGAYDKAKRARRILRARVLRPESEGIPPCDQEILADLYDEQMETLIDAQLELESIEFRMRGNAGLFAPLSELDGAAGRIRMYLHATVEEYQDRRTEFAGNPPEAPLAELPALLGFIGSYGRGQAWREFNKPFQNALRCLRLAIQERSGAGAEDPSSVSTDPSGKVSTRGLGADDEMVRLRAHNWEWPSRFREESERLQAELDQRFDTIEHVGSTGVRGLWAVPVIDMLARVPALSDDEKEQLREDLARLNYELCPGPDGVDLAFRQYVNGLWTHSLAVVQPGSGYFDPCLQMRNHLINDSASRREYDSKKQSLAIKYAQDPEAYQREKTELIADLHAKLVEAGPSAPAIDPQS